MRVRSTFLLLFLVGGLSASETGDRAQKYEDAGDSAAAREVYSKALQAAPDDPELLTGYAQILERYRDPGARDAYRKSARLWKNAGRTQDALRSARRAVLLDSIAGDRAATEADFRIYRDLGGTGLRLPEPPSGGIPRASVPIPGPIRSFARMAALSSGHPAGRHSCRAGAQRGDQRVSRLRARTTELEETEYLKLVRRYLSQARELETLAGPDKVIRIEMCDSTQTNDLLRILGYRMRGGCGSEVVLETVNAARAFITTDSGFPLAELEQALRTDKPFSYDYHSSQATIVFTPDYWLSARRKGAG